MSFIEGANPDHLRRNKLGPNYGDWLAPDPKTPRDLAATAYWALIAEMMRKMALRLGVRRMRRSMRRLVMRFVRLIRRLI